MTAIFIQIIFYVFILATAVQLFFWLFIFSRFAFYRPLQNFANDCQNKPPPVSIIICARNEAENLKKNLPRILNQNYHSYEVIVVNDCSTDNTENILLNFHINYPILCLLSVQNKTKGSGKKAALSKGIEAAKHQVLLFTDADCQPASDNWLYEMQKTLKGPIEIVLGYGPYNREEGFLNTFIRFETIYTAIQYFSFALIGQPYMGVGRNLMYKKSLFEKADGFAKHQHILSGDDDLFINEVATAGNVGINISKDAFVYSDPKHTWRNYYRQKVRHMSTGKHYRLTHQFLLGIVSLSHFFHYFGGLMLVFVKTSMIFVFFLYVARILVLYVMYRLILKKTQETTLLPLLPVLDAVYIFFYLVFALPLIYGKTDRWK